MKGKVSFDFDSTLDKPEVQKYAKNLINRGYEVWIVTSRFDDKNITDEHPSWMKKGNFWKDNNDLREVAEKVGIPSERIVYTNMKSKSTFLKGKDFIFHLDDDEVELEEIEKIPNTVGVNVWDNPQWKEECENILKSNLST